MKMNKKGFTLIELLAVIVILAIIALIATPIIMGIIDDAKKNSARNSAYGYLDSIDKTIVSSSFNAQTIQTLDGNYKIVSNGTAIQKGSETAITISFKGTAPEVSEGTEVLKYSAGVLQKCSDIKVGEYYFHTTSNDGKLVDGKSTDDSTNCGA